MDSKVEENNQGRFDMILGLKIVDDRGIESLKIIALD